MIVDSWVINLIKRIIAIVFILLFILGFNASAKTVATPNVEPFGDFTSYQENNEKVSDILGIEDSKIKEYCNTNNVIYLAVNKDNTKQIRLTASVTDFSNSIINISNLTNEKIKSIISEITGLEKVKGNIIEKNGQKFIRIDVKTNDSGGEYILTQYITVANKTRYILSFYTNPKADIEYIEKTFESYSSSGIFNNSEEKINTIYIVVIIAFILFLGISVFICYTIIRDIKKDKSKESE